MTAQQRFGPQQRIKKKHEFERIFTQARQCRGTMLNIWASETPAAETHAKARLGLVVSRKSQALATARNLWKRRIREIFRRNQDKIKTGIDVLVRVRRQQKKPRYEILEREFLELLGQLNVIKRV